MRLYCSFSNCHNYGKPGKIHTEFCPISCNCMWIYHELKKKKLQLKMTLLEVYFIPRWVPGKKETTYFLKNEETICLKMGCLPQDHNYVFIRSSQGCRGTSKASGSQWGSNTSWTVKQWGCTAVVLLEGIEIKMSKQKPSAQPFLLISKVSVKRFCED